MTERRSSSTAVERWLHPTLSKEVKILFKKLQIFTSVVGLVRIKSYQDGNFIEGTSDISGFVQN